MVRGISLLPDSLGRGNVEKYGTGKDAKGGLGSSGKKEYIPFGFFEEDIKEASVSLGSRSSTSKRDKRLRQDGVRWPMGKSKGGGVRID